MDLVGDRCERDWAIVVRILFTAFFVYGASDPQSCGVFPESQLC